MRQASAQASAAVLLVADDRADLGGQLTPVGAAQEIAEAVDAANAKVSKAEAIKKFSILDTDFTIDSGELTPTMKLKRNIIHSAHQKAIADLYT